MPTRRIERASVVARGGVRRVLLHANPSRPAPPVRRARLGARRRCRSSLLRRSSNLRRRLQRLAVHGVRAERQIERTNDRHAFIVAQHVGRRQLTTKRTRPQTQQTARSNRTVCWLLDRRRRRRAGTRDRRRRGRLSRISFESNRRRRRQRRRTECRSNCYGD
jgi:hypothetical protein